LGLKILLDEEKKKYFEAREKFNQTNNPGYYFRNNVWWWRPLADYVLQLMANMFSEDEKNQNGIIMRI
jgi:hypothetical protein